MDRALLKAFSLLSISLGLAVIFNFLFFEKIIGISVFIFTVILLGMVFFFRQQEELDVKNSRWLVFLIAFFALMPAIRANEFLTFLNICALLSLLLLLAYQLTGTPTFLMKLRDYLLLVTLVPLRMLGRAYFTVSLIGQSYSDLVHRDTLIRIIKGAVMSVPILIIFGFLFSQADLVFSQFLNHLVNIQISDRTLGYSVLLTLAFIATMSFLSYIFFPKPIPQTLPPELPNTRRKSDRGIETLVFLGLISTLFLVFIGFQITYLFGGETNIMNAGFTYAEYARRGFWELLAVAILSLVVLLASEKYANAESRRDKRFLIPALLLIIEVIIVIVSAFKRLSLYIDTYGMTELRFYVCGFIILLFALFTLLAIKFIQSKSEQFFTFTTLLSNIVFLIGINIVNPDAYILKVNLEQYGLTGKIDILYAGSLSTDAELLKIKLYKELEGEEKETFRELLEKEKNNLLSNSADWQSTNFSHIQALKLLNTLY